MAECKRVDDRDDEPPQGGYCDVDFIDPPPDSLQCLVCLSTLKTPSGCGNKSTRENNNGGWGYPQTLSHNKLHGSNSQYIYSITV